MHDVHTQDGPRIGMRTVIVHVADVSRAVTFYREYLDVEVIGEPTSEGAVLDVVSARIELRRIDGAPSTWEEDDLVSGFRHIGFKVADLDGLVARLRAGAVSFRAEPMDTGVGVRTAFFFDPDGTVLEIIEGFVDYMDLVDPALVAAERAPGIPDRPRFDHVATTAHDLDATVAAYAPLGFRRIGVLHVPDEPRGFRIDYLLAGSSILEVFTFVSPTRQGVVRAGTYGYAGVEIAGLEHPLPGSEVVEESAARTILRDADQLAYAIAHEATAVAR